MYTMDDDEVVRRVCAGEAEMFEVVIRRYNRRLYRVTRAILKDDAEAEDAMQQAYLSAYTHLVQFGHSASFAIWLTRVAVNEALARARRARRYTPPAAEDGGVSCFRTPEEGAAAVDALPEIYRVVFVLRELEGLSTAETAACLELDDDAIKVRLHRAKRLLRDDLLERAGGARAGTYAFHLGRCERITNAVMTHILAMESALAHLSS